ncbi:MAG: GGDEF domain-containing protein [Burkholderiaceae bacterium]
MSAPALKPTAGEPNNLGGDWGDKTQQRITIGAAFLGPTLLLFAVYNYLAYDATRMASVSLVAGFLAALAFYFVRYRQDTLISSNALTASLYVQVFGEMLLNGGLSAPATPLVTLIVPAAYLLCPDGHKLILRWGLIVGVSLASIAALESVGLTLSNELSADAQRFDKLLSTTLGVLCAAYLTRLFANQANSAMWALARERQQFQQLALFDTLTGLPNRENFFADAQRRLQDAAANQSRYSLVFIDIDRFKQINDTLGHAAGDNLLQQVGNRLGQLCTEFRLVARLAGDEFIVIARDVGLGADGEALKSWIERLFEDPFDLNGQQFDINVSAGLARFPADGDSLEELIHCADQRMYEAKHNRKSISSAYVHSRAAVMDAR